MVSVLDALSPARVPARRAPSTFSIGRARLAQELAGQRVHCEGRSRFYVAVLAEIEDAVRRSPPWLDQLEDAWRDRRFAVGWEAAHLLLANLHYAALAEEGDDLPGVYPSCGGTGHPGGAVARFLEDAPPAFWRRLSENFVQTNEVDRSVAWMIVAASAFIARNMPFHLVELGTSAGLNLAGDHLAHACDFVTVGGTVTSPPVPWDERPHPLITRAGLDIRPRQVGFCCDRLWLRACVWADDAARLARLDRAIAAYLRLSEGATPPMLANCDFAGSPGWLLENRRARDGEGLLVFNSIGTVYLADEEYDELRSGMARALAPWGDRALWVEYERRRGAGSKELELSVHRVRDGQLRSRVLARGEPRPRRMTLLEGWDFLPGR